MKTLTVEEATPGLGRLVELALAGEQIQIRKGNGVVELRPAQMSQTAVKEQLTPREALRRLQEEGRLTPKQAEAYLCEVREERLAADLFNKTGRRRGSRFDCLIASTAIQEQAEVATVKQTNFKLFVPHGLKLAVAPTPSSPTTEP